MGRAANVWQLTALTAALWFLGGLGLALLAILAGLLAGEHERGRVFGILGLTTGLGSLIGGLGTGAAASLPLTPIVGLLSDRLGRKRFLLASYLLSAVGLVVLGLSTTLWHFIVASLLLTLQGPLSGSIVPAWLNDLVPRDAVSKGMSLYSATGWVAGILGFLGAGQAIQWLGMAPTYGIGVGSMVVALVLAVSIRRQRKKPGF